MGVDVQVTGPLFDGRAAKIMAKAGQDAEEAVARAGAQAVRARVAHRARNSSGRFASRTVADRAHAGGFQVHTPGLRYVSWLEGTARRNAHSGFKGYQLYREARQEVDARSAGIAGEHIQRGVREING